MGKKLFTLFLMIVLSLTVTGCGIINTVDTGGGTVHVEVDLDNVFLNVESQIPKTAITEDITLPTKFGSVTVKWESDNKNIIDNNGHIVRPETDTDVYLTCILTSDAETKTYRVRVTIKAKEKEQVFTIRDVLNGAVGESYKTRGYVLALSKRGALISDGTGMIYIYGGETFDYTSVNVGSTLSVEGKTSMYGGKPQFSAPTVTVLDNGNVSYPTARELNFKDFDALFSETAPIEYVSFEGTLSVSGGYTNVTISGATYTGSLVYPIMDYSSLNGKRVTVKGFFVYISGNRFINFLATSVTEKSEQVASIPEAYQGVYEGNDSEGHFMHIEVLETSVNVTDPTGKVMQFTLYQDSTGYYFVDEGQQIYSTFTDNSVTNAMGTFYRKVEETHVAAHLTSSQQGEYEGYDSDHNHMTVEVFESRVKVSVNVRVFEYDLYEDKQGIYFMEGSEKAYCTFGNNTVTNKYGTFTKKQETPPTPTVATIPADYQGEYVYTTDEAQVVATVSESTLTIVTNPFTIYVSGSRYYILDGTTQVTVEFVGKELKVGSITYIRKQVTPPTPTAASIPASQQGEYEGYDGDGTYMTVEVSESIAKITVGNRVFEYNLYVDDQGIYFMEGSSNVYCTFGNNTVTNKYGTFTKKGTTPPTPTVASIPEAYQGQYENETVQVVATVSEHTLALGTSTYTIYAQTGGGYYILDGATEVTVEFVGKELKVGSMAYIKKSTTPVEEPVPGTIPTDRLGTYRNTAFGDLTLTETAVVIGTVSYQVYILDNQLYIIKDGANTNITFVSANEFKLGEYMYALVSTEPGKTPAKLSEAEQGEYEGYMATGAVMTLILSESKAKVSFASQVTEYDLYIDDQGIYFMDGTDKVYSKFGDNTVTNKFGTFTKKGTTPPTPTVASIPEAY
ncbi:MAG: hypothetical protein J6T34_05345, partial [Bacilli bacterium]|nr:hypothetical protein [Bacilli bacterium]